MKNRPIHRRLQHALIAVLILPLTGFALPAQADGGLGIVAALLGGTLLGSSVHSYPYPYGYAGYSVTYGYIGYPVSYVPSYTSVVYGTLPPPVPVPVFNSGYVTAPVYVIH